MNCHNRMLKPLFTTLTIAVAFIAFQAYAIDAEADKRIRATMAELLPEQAVTKISATPFDGLYEVILGTNVVYMSGDGRYILRGDMLDMRERENLSEKQRISARKEIFDALSEAEYIEFSPPHPDHHLYVFTDIDCGYCRRLHQDVPVLNKNGIGVRYLAYPRGGMDSNTSRTMEDVWCAKDRQQALTDAKNGKNVPQANCENPVAEDYELGRKLGIRGTPAIYTDDGEELRGYVPPGQLIDIVTGDK